MCFNKFRFPRLQFDHLFHGCHPAWGHAYRQIREWLMPPWLLAVQGLLTLGLVLSSLARILSVAAVWRAPRPVWLRFSAPKSSIRRFVITEKAPTRAFSWLKAATTAFTFKTPL